MKKILVVDDEENIRTLYKEELSEMGYDVVTVHDGIEALAAMNTDEVRPGHPGHAHGGNGRH